MPQALPWIIGASTVYNLGRDVGLWGPQPPQLPPPPPTLDFAQARDLAAQVLDPLYQDVLENRLRDVQRRQIATGFFGQLPGAEQATRAAADVERSRVGQIGNLAVQLQGQTQDQAARHAALQVQAQQMAMQRNPMNSVTGGLAALGQVAELFPDALDVFTRTTGGWLGGGGAGGSSRPVNFANVTRALEFWTPSNASLGPLISSYPYGSALRPGSATMTSWINPYGG